MTFLKLNFLLSMLLFKQAMRKYAARNNNNGFPRLTRAQRNAAFPMRGETRQAFNRRIGLGMIQRAKTPEAVAAGRRVARQANK